MTGETGVPTSLMVAELTELIYYPTPSSDRQVALLISRTGGHTGTGPVLGIVRYVGLLFNIFYQEAAAVWEN